MMRIGIASDHAGFELKSAITLKLDTNGYEVRDFGAHQLDLEDDYPNYVVPLARSLAEKKIERGIAICGSGVGACIAANKIEGVRAALVSDTFTAHQGVEDDDMNVLCLGGRVLGPALAWELVQAFLGAHFNDIDRHLRRLAMLQALEK